jgi:urate oxidase
VILGDNQYGKAETRVVRVDRAAGGHVLHDLNVTVTLRGDFAATYLTGDNSAVLPTDTMKNTVYAFARAGAGQIEEFGLRLARHFVATQPAVAAARVAIEEYGWQRRGPHVFVRDGSAVRTAVLTCDGRGAYAVGGVSGLVLLASTGSEFTGFVRDAYTTLPEATDRILATEVTAAWRFASAEASWAQVFDTARTALVDAFAELPSCSLQQTLHRMATGVLTACPELVEVRLTLPNRHHLLVDLAPFGLDNPGEVFVASDRPYGLIEGTVSREGAPPAPLAWW